MGLACCEKSDHRTDGIGTDGGSPTKPPGVPCRSSASGWLLALLALAALLLAAGGAWACLRRRGRRGQGDKEEFASTRAPR